MGSRAVEEDKRKGNKTSVAIALGGLTLWHAILITRGETSIERHINCKETKRLKEKGKKPTSFWENQQLESTLWCGEEKSLVDSSSVAIWPRPLWRWTDVGLVPSKKRPGGNLTSKILGAGTPSHLSMTQQWGLESVPQLLGLWRQHLNLNMLENCLLNGLRPD
ncbi:hypothetical protein JZ751_007946 [Albula glossodonta]|uniref:Uncharacterized protein n=1 Tax=Albula glossodonta TaxID=121402 RepID=A0A8T2P9C7_9TELE|nr:hypothetical protein JZ751_007946 [Albula glossodonta]